MKLRITGKLFLAILLTNVVIAVAFGVATQVSVDRGFREYVRDREERRLQFISEDLANAYVEKGETWEFVRNDEGGWQRLTRQEHGPPPRLGPGHVRPPPREKAAIARGEGLGNGPPAPPKDILPPRPKGPPFPPGPMAGTGVPFGSIELSLLDANRAHVVGPAISGANESLTQPVIVKGSTVGWLVARGPAFGGADTRFLQQQLRTSWIIGGLAILLAAVVAIPLARGFLSPIRRLAKATHRLAAGDYAPRIEASTRDELGQLIGDFNRLAQTLQNSEQARRGFLADISHELRTPLAVLKAELEALQDGVRSLTPEAVRSLQAEVAILGVLINDLYDLAVADLGAVHYRMERVDLADLMRTTLRGFAPRFSEHQLMVDDSRISGTPLVVKGDARRITQVLNNVLENTIRYTDAGGLVEIAVARSGRNVVVDVHDSAPGVAAELLPRLFERLFRVESSRNRARGGSGLGLSLCRSILDAHGGEISAHSSPLGGLWVRVRLPLAEKWAHSPASGPHEVAA